MATTLYGLGPHSITTNDDFDLAAGAGEPGHDTDVTLHLEFGTFDGNVTVKSRGRGSGGTFVTQSYVKPDETVAAAALAATTVVRVKTTGKNLRLTTAARTTGTLTLTILKDVEG